jgi:hypothetical protein
LSPVFFSSPEKPPARRRSCRGAIVRASPVGKIGFPGVLLPNRRRALLSTLFFCCNFAYAQDVVFDIQTHPDSPIALVNYTPRTLRIEGDRRQFLTVRNDSNRAAVAVVFQEAIGSGSKTEIVAIERVSVLIGPREKKRLSVGVQNVWDRIQAAAKAGETIGRPALSVVAVEFIGGSSWNVP